MGTVGAQAPYPPKLHGVNREGEERGREKKKEIKKKRGAGGRRKTSP